MKKKLILTISLLCNSLIFAQKFEVIKEIKFGDPIKYYEKWDPVEGSHPGIYQIQNWKNEIILYDKDNHRYINLTDYNQSKGYDSLYNVVSYCQNNNLLVLGEKGSINQIDIYKNNYDIQNPDYTIDFNNIKDKFNFTLYYTENKLFAKVDSSSLVYWELLPNKQTKFHNEEQTKYELEDGLAKQLGIVIDSEGVYFGETCIDFVMPPNYKSYWKDISIITEKYKGFGNKFGGCLGTDKRGLSYFDMYKNSANDKRPKKNPNLPIIVYISVLDPWTHNLYMIELPEGNWNPARNEDGLIASLSNCIDSEGNIYFTDCNKEKGCYEIKKLSNDWIKQYDFYKREIGIMNSNHIPLYNESKSTADNNGYNFEHEYLWILEHKKDWCKVRKVDGREGWVETKYINFNEDKSNDNNAQIDSNINNKISKTNVSINKKMICTDNLRLRSEEETSSQIITTMAKGTKVKVLKLGKSEIIDNIPSNWVQVEILKDAKDKDGNPIKAGIIGWCYGGYLE